MRESGRSSDAFYVAVNNLRSTITQNATEAGVKKIMEMIGYPDPGAHPSWLEYQGSCFGIYISQFYLFNPLEERIEMLREGEKESWIEFPTIDYSGDRWVYDPETDQRLKTEIANIRPTKEPEFHTILSVDKSWRLSAREQQNNLLVSHEGEVNAFIFEWALRLAFEHDRIPPDSESVNRWLDSLFAPDGPMTQECRRLGIVSNNGDLLPRGRYFVEWLIQIIRDEYAGTSNYLAKHEGGEPWTQMFINVRTPTPQDFEHAINDSATGLKQLHFIASQMLSERGVSRSSKDVEKRARFFINGHRAYRLDDNQQVKNAFAFRIVSAKYPAYAVGGMFLQDMFDQNLPSPVKYDVRAEVRINECRQTLALLAYTALSAKYAKLAEAHATLTTNMGNVAAGAHILKGRINPIVRGIGRLKRELVLTCPDLLPKINDLEWKANQAETTAEKAIKIFKRFEKLSPQEAKPLLVHASIRQAAENVDMASRGCTLYVQPSPEVELKGDFDYFYFMIEELFLNALAACHTAKVEPCLTARVEERGNLVFIFVEDNGEGDPNMIGPITREFDSVQMRSHLGRIIMRRVADIHHGEIGYLRSDKQGTMALIVLPKDLSPHVAATAFKAELNIHQDANS